MTPFISGRIKMSRMYKYTWKARNNNYPRRCGPARYTHVAFRTISGVLIGTWCKFEMFRVAIMTELIEAYKASDVEGAINCTKKVGDGQRKPLRGWLEQNKRKSWRLDTPPPPGAKKETVEELYHSIENSRWQIMGCFQQTFWNSLVTSLRGQKLLNTRHEKAIDKKASPGST